MAGEVRAGLGRLRQGGRRRPAAHRRGEEGRRRRLGCCALSESGQRRRAWPLRVVERLSELAGYTSAVFILAAVLVVCYGVLLRYFIGASTVWQTELSIYLLIYAAFVGAAYGLKHGDHVAMEIVASRFSGRARDVIRLVVGVLGLGLAVVILVVAWGFWWEVVESGRRSGTAWNPPLAVPYAILPLGMLLVSLQYLVILTDTVGRLGKGNRADGAEAGR
ncbi:MAG: TRAP transporter small permease subunit [Streptosporangiales bacterium]|nr:TRAP transporter small permease subunit [Streptosporangiales bacterium]